MSEKLFYLDLKQSFINQEIKVLDIVGVNHCVVNSVARKPKIQISYIIGFIATKIFL